MTPSLVRLGKRKTVSGCSAKGCPVANERIIFGGESVEGRAHDPRVLHELKLAADTGIQGDEIEPAFLAVLPTLQRLFRGQRGPILASAPQQAVEADRRDCVGAE